MIGLAFDALILSAVVVTTHDQSIVDSMRRRVIELDHGDVVRDQERGVYG
jgi:cell division transport system ATP-binding protein